MPFQHRFLSVLAPFWRAKMAPKSIKNRSKLSFRALLFRHRFLYRCLIDFSSQLRTAGSQKTLFFLWKTMVFSKNGLSKISIDFLINFGSVLASNMGASWGPRRLQIRKNGAKKIRCSPPKSVLNTIFLQNIVSDLSLIHI